MRTFSLETCTYPQSSICESESASTSQMSIEDTVSDTMVNKIQEFERLGIKPRKFNPILAKCGMAPVCSKWLKNYLDSIWRNNRVASKVKGMVFTSY